MVQKGLLIFLGFFLSNAEFSPFWTLSECIRALIHLACLRSFQWRHGLLFTDCIVWDDKDRVTGLKRSHWIHLGWWSTGSPKLQLFQLSQHSHATNCRLISSSAYFPWTMTLKYKMQLSECPWDTTLQSKSRTQFFFYEGRNIFFWRFVSRSDYTKVPEVVFATSL